MDALRRARGRSGIAEPAPAPAADPGASVAPSGSQLDSIEAAGYEKGRQAVLEDQRPEAGRQLQNAAPPSLHRTPGIVEQARNWFRAFRDEPIGTAQQLAQRAAETVLPETEREEVMRRFPNQRAPGPDYRPQTILMRAVREAAALGPGLSSLIGETSKRAIEAMPRGYGVEGRSPLEPEEEARDRARRMVAREELGQLVKGAASGFAESLWKTAGVLHGEPMETVAQATEHPLEFLGNVLIGPGLIRSAGERAGAMRAGLKKARIERAGAMATELGVEPSQIRIRPGRVELVSGVVDRTAKVLGDPKPVVDAVRKTVNVLRSKDAGLDGALKRVDAFIDEHIDPRLEAADYARRARAHRQAIVEEGFRWRRRLKKETAEAFSGLTGDERSHFYRYVAGLEELPEAPSPGLEKAYNWWSSHSAQWQLAWMEAERLTPETAWVRRYQPLRIEKYGFEGEEGEAALQALRRKEAFRGINREALRAMRSQNRVDRLIGLFQRGEKWKGEPRAAQPPAARFDWSQAPELSPEGAWLRDQWLAATRAEGSLMTKQEAHYVAAALDPAAKVIASRLGISPREWYAKSFYGATAGWADLGNGKVLMQDFEAPPETFYSRLRETIRNAPELAKPQTGETLARIMGKGGKVAQRYSLDEYSFSGLKFWIESRHAAERGVRALNKLMPRLVRELGSKGVAEESATQLVGDYLSARAGVVAREDAGTDLFARALFKNLSEETTQALNSAIDDVRHGMVGHLDVAPIGDFKVEKGQIALPPPIERAHLEEFMDKYPLALSDILQSGTLSDASTVNTSFYTNAKMDAAAGEGHVDVVRRNLDELVAAMSEHVAAVEEQLRGAGILGEGERANQHDVRLLALQQLKGWTGSAEARQAILAMPWAGASETAFGAIADALRASRELVGGARARAAAQWKQAMSAGQYWSEHGPWNRAGGGYSVGGGMAYVLRMTKFHRDKSAATAMKFALGKSLRITESEWEDVFGGGNAEEALQRLATRLPKNQWVQLAEAADATRELPSGHWEGRGRDIFAHERFSVYPSRAGDQVYVSQELQWDPWEGIQRNRGTGERDYAKLYDAYQTMERVGDHNDPEWDKAHVFVRGEWDKQGQVFPWFAKGGGIGFDLSIMRMLNTAQRLGTRKVGLMPGIVNAIRNNHVSYDVDMLKVALVEDDGWANIPGIGRRQASGTRKFKPGEIVVYANNSGGPIEASRAGGSIASYDLDRLTMAIEHPDDPRLPNLDSEAGQRYFKFVRDFGSEWSQRMYARFTSKLERKYGADWLERMEGREKEIARHLKEIVPTYGPREALAELAKRKRAGWEERLRGGAREDYVRLQAAVAEQQSLAEAAKYSKVNARRLAEEIFARARAGAPKGLEGRDVKLAEARQFERLNGEYPYSMFLDELPPEEFEAIKSKVVQDYGEREWENERHYYTRIMVRRRNQYEDARAALEHLHQITADALTEAQNRNLSPRTVPEIVIKLPVTLPYFGGSGSKLNYDVDMANRIVARARDLMRAKGYKNEERLKSLKWQPELIDITNPTQQAQNTHDYIHPPYTPEYLEQMKQAERRWNGYTNTEYLRWFLGENHTDAPDVRLRSVPDELLWQMGATKAVRPGPPKLQYMEVPVLELSKDELDLFSSVPLLKKHRTGGIKGAAEQLQDGRWVIRAFASSDVTTFAHEIAHVVRNRLSPDLLADLERIRGVRDGVWSVDDEEWFAHSWEKFLMDGRAPDPSLFEVFRQLSEWIGKIYSGGFGLSQYAVAPPLRKFFHTLMGFDSDPNALGIQPYPLEKLFSYSELGPALKARRERFGMTEEEVAARAGIDVQRVKDIEGTGQATRREKRSMAAALRLEPKSVVKYKKQEPKPYTPASPWEGWEERPYQPWKGSSLEEARKAWGPSSLPPEPPKEPGLDLKQRMYRLGMDKKTLAESAGISPVTLEMVFSGQIGKGSSVERVMRVLEEEEKLQADVPDFRGQEAGPRLVDTGTADDEALVARLRELKWSEEDIQQTLNARRLMRGEEGGGETPEGGPLMQTTRDQPAEFLSKLVPGSALHMLAERTHQLSEDFAARGKNAPMYWPFIRKAKPSDFFPSPLDQTRRTSPKSMKLSTGATYVSGSFVKNPQEVAFRHYLEIMRYISTERLIASVMNDEKIPKRLFNGEPLGPNEELFAPDGFIRLYRQAIDFGDDIIEYLDRYGMADDAAAQALRDAAARGDFSTTAAGVARAQVYVMPKSVMKELRAQWTPAPKWVRLLIDRPTDWWVTATLAFRPAWIVNNAVGGVIFSLLGGTAPQDYIRAMLPEFVAKTPEEAGGGLAAALTTQAGEFTHLGRHADTVLGSIITYLESLPPQRQLGEVADHINAFNAGLESFFRRANFIHHSAKQARLNYMKRTGDLFFKAYNLLDEMDTMTPDQVKGAVEATNRFMGNYMNLQPWERQWFRRVVRFYSFMKHQTMLLMGMPVYAPMRYAMLNNVTQAAQEMAEQDSAPLPEYLQGKGLIDTGVSITAGDPPRPLRVFANTQGWNPLILGFATGSEGIRDLSDLPRLVASQGSPLTQYGAATLTRRSSMGQPFTEPGTVEVDGRFWRRMEDLKGYAGVVKKTHPNEGVAEVEPPIPDPWEFYAGSFPQVQLARRLQNPNAGFTAEPFSAESPRQGGVTERTRLTEMLRYFGVSFVLVDTTQARALPISRSTMRSIIRKMSRQEAARRKGKEAQNGSQH